jgi:WD repeat-containing protein 55
MQMMDEESESSSDEDFPEQDAEDDSDFLVESSDNEMDDEGDNTKKEIEGSRENPNRVVEDYDPNNEDDEVVKKILTELKKPRLKPPNIQTEDFPTDLSFHPNQNILAVGTVMGDLLVYKYSNDENVLVSTHEVHTKAIRDIEFSTDGSVIFSGGRDKSIMMTDFETGKLKRFWDKSHDDPIYTLSVVNES